MRRPFPLLAMVVMALAVASACSSGGSETTAGGATDRTTGRAAAASTTVAPTTAVAGPEGTAGCGTRPDDVDARHLAARTIDSSGGARDFLVYVPDAYRGDEPTPVVFNFHGAGSNKEEQLAYSAFGPLADRDGWLVVAPDALGSPRRWSPYGVGGGVGVDGVNDLDFFADALDAVEGEFCIDTTRVYVTGMSSGGFMTAAVACAEGDVVAAAGPVTATVYADGACDDAPPVPYVYFHGTDDPVVPFLGPVPGPDGEPGPGAAEVSAAAWAEHNGCGPDPVDERIGTDVVHRHWEGCDAPTDLYIVEGGGHTWPGGLVDLPQFGHTTRDISASEIVWELFASSQRG